MGFFDFLSRGRSKAQRRAALVKERAGDIEGAIELYVSAGCGDDAARLLLLRADADGNAERKMAFCARAAEVATDPEKKRDARRRRADIGFDLLRGKGGSVLRGELLRVAAELEACEAFERAADAYALAGDAEGEVRALTAAGAIERLEERLRATDAEAKSENDRSRLLRRVADLDRTAERREALRLCAEQLGRERDDQIAAAALAVRSRLVRGPIVDLVVDGERRRFALGDEVTVGRGDATIVIGARAVSRKHVRLFRNEQGAFLEDLGTRNGTTLAGARLSGPMAIGEELRVALGGEIPLVVRRIGRAGSLGEVWRIDVAGDAWLAPLGPLPVGDGAITWDRGDTETFVTLRTGPSQSPPFLGPLQLARAVELAVGDEIASARGGPTFLSVPGGQPEPALGAA